MKKTNYLILAVVALLIAACGKVKNNNHYVTLVKPSDAVAYLFADEDVDTLKFYTTDTWSVSSSESWLTIDPSQMSGKIDYAAGYYAVAAPVLKFDNNLTGESRAAYVSIDINGEDDFVRTIKAYYYQYGVHRVKGCYAIKSNPEGTQFYYARLDSSQCVKDTLRFSTKNAWTLTSSNESSVKPLITSGKGGDSAVPLTMPVNNLSDTVKTRLTLVSGGITTPIEIWQMPKK